MTTYDRGVALRTCQLDIVLIAGIADDNISGNECCGQHGGDKGSVEELHFIRNLDFFMT